MLTCVVLLVAAVASALADAALYRGGGKGIRIEFRVKGGEVAYALVRTTLHCTERGDRSRQRRRYGSVWGDGPRPPVVSSWGSRLAIDSRGRFEQPQYDGLEEPGFSSEEVFSGRVGTRAIRGVFGFEWEYRTFGRHEICRTNHFRGFGPRRIHFRARRVHPASRPSRPSRWVRVARGKSIHGVPWRIQARRVPATAGQRRALEVHFSIGKGNNGSGYFKGLSLPLRRSFVLSANVGTEIDPYPEGDLSGVARPLVRKIVARMSDGTALTIRPRLAPKRLRKRYPWSRSLRYFDAFFPAGLKPLRVVAYDRKGRRLAGGKNRRGVFEVRFR